MKKKKRSKELCKYFEAALCVCIMWRTSPQVHNFAITFVREVEGGVIQDESKWDEKWKLYKFGLWCEIQPTEAMVYLRWKVAVSTMILLDKEKDSAVSNIRSGIYSGLADQGQQHGSRVKRLEKEIAIGWRRNLRCRSKCTNPIQWTPVHRGDTFQIRIRSLAQ